MGTTMLRRTLMFAVSLLISSVYSFSVLAESAPYRFGGYAGANINNYTTTPALTSTNYTGLLLGVEMDMGIHSVFHLNPQFRFVQKGFSYTQAGFTTEAVANYLEFPLLVKAVFPTGSLISPHIVFGPNLGIKIGDTVTVPNGSIIALRYSSIDIAIDMGVGAEIEIQNGLSGYLQFRYSLGVYDVADATTNDWKSRGMQIIAGILFPI